MHGALILQEPDHRILEKSRSQIPGLLQALALDTTFPPKDGKKRNRNRG